MLPRKSQKLEFLAVRIIFFWLAASFDVKKLVKSQQKLLAASLKIPQLRSMTIASDRRKYLIYCHSKLLRSVEYGTVLVPNKLVVLVC